LPLGAKLRIDLWAIYGGPGGAVESRVITADDDPNKERSISMFISTKKLNALGGLGPGNTQPFYKKGSSPGLPDGLFPNQKSQFGYILEGLM
jgi:hypothetical protein